MAEMNAGLQQLDYAYLSHEYSLMYAIGCRAGGADPVIATEVAIRAGPRSVAARVEESG